MSIDIETIERAIIEGVAPLQLEDLARWILPLDRGAVNRAISAVPLHHSEHAPRVLESIVERYRAHRLRPQFRLADVPGLSALLAELAGLGFEPGPPTYMQCIETLRIDADSGGFDVTLAATPNAGWNRVIPQRGVLLWRAERACGALGARREELVRNIARRG